MPVPLPPGLLDLLRGASPCFVATAMPDGSPQLTETWVATDGEHIQINIVQGMQKAKNLARDPRIAVNVIDPENPARYYAIRGQVISMTTEGGAESLEEISQRYLGRSYPNFRGVPQTRLLVTIAAESIREPPDWDR